MVKLGIYPDILAETFPVQKLGNNSFKLSFLVLPKRSIDINNMFMKSFAFHPFEHSDQKEKKICNKFFNASSYFSLLHFFTLGI